MRPLPPLTGTPDEIAQAEPIRAKFRALFADYHRGNPTIRHNWTPMFQFILIATRARFWIANEWRLERASAIWQLNLWHEELIAAQGGLGFNETRME